MVRVLTFKSFISTAERIRVSNLWRPDQCDPRSSSGIKRGGQAAIRLAKVEPGHQPLERAEVGGELADKPGDELVDVPLHSAPDTADGVEVLVPDHLVGPMTNHLIKLRADDLDQGQDTVLAPRIVPQDPDCDPFGESFSVAEPYFSKGISLAPGIGSVEVGRRIASTRHSSRSRSAGTRASQSRYGRRCAADR